MDDHPSHQRSDAEALFALEVAVAELIGSSESHARTVIARIELLETTFMTTLTDITTKLGTLSTMLDAKKKSDEADLTAIGSQIDDIIEAHTDTPTTTVTTTVAAIDPTTGLPVT